MNPNEVLQIAKLQSPVIADIAEDGDNIDSNKIPFAIVPQGMEIKTLKFLEDERLEKPRRRKGTITAKNLESFCALTNRFKGESSVIFSNGTVDADDISASLKAIINYNPTGPDDKKTEWGDHVVDYDFPVSKYLRRWLMNDGETMSQEDFARWLDDNIGDLCEGKAEDTGLHFGGHGTPIFAKPAEIFLLQKGLEIRVEEKLIDKRNISNGTAQLQYSTENKDADGQPLNVPSWFMLGLPVFEDGQVFRIAVRLRYRAHGGRVMWSYEIFRIEEIFDMAFNKTCELAAEKTQLPIFKGVKES